MAYFTIEEYLQSLSPERVVAMERLREVIKKNLPYGFEETLSYGMIGYVVPHSLYPNGYHCNPKQPLPFVNIASQKNFIALYHMGIYANPELLEWFVSEYQKHVQSKPDMGKSCIRFKKIDRIPYSLIGELMTKMSPEDWIVIYEKSLNRK